jgi:uncharacterized protein (DUF3820 family)
MARAMTRDGDSTGAGPDPGTVEEPEQTVPDSRILIDLATMRMPFGRYRGRVLVDLPEPYVVWFRRNGFPKGRLGVLLATLYEVKANGLEPLIREVGKRSTGALPPS